MYGEGNSRIKFLIDTCPLEIQSPTTENLFHLSLPWVNQIPQLLIISFLFFLAKYLSKRQRSANEPEYVPIYQILAKTP